MQPALQLSFADSLGGLWAALHKDVELTICEDEVHYLRTVAVTLDDDVTSCLLLRKLRMAHIVRDAELSRKTVSMNSYLEFVHNGGPPQFCQLIHPSPHAPAYGLPITSLLGAGLIGLRSGQTILWPDERGTLCDLTIVQVEKCPGLTDWLGPRSPS